MQLKGRRHVEKRRDFRAGSLTCPVHSPLAKAASRLPGVVLSVLSEISAQRGGREGQEGRSMESAGVAGPEGGEEIDPWGGEDEIEQSPSSRSQDLPREWEARRLQFHNVSFSSGFRVSLKFFARRVHDG